MLTRETTPIEEYKLKNKVVFVKREDLFGLYPAPPLGKLRGLKFLLDELYSRGERLVGCWDTRVSKLGQGVAAMCSIMPGMKAVVSYPQLNGHPVPEAVQIAKTLDALIYPIRGNHVSICHSQVRKYVENLGGTMLPFGLECVESVEAIALEAAKVPRECLSDGTLVLSCGSGVTLAGILKGVIAQPRKVFGLSSGRSVNKIIACLNRYHSHFRTELTILPAKTPYYEFGKIDCPFPTHPNYDLKAWQYLHENIDQLPEPILFWNIGA